MSAARAAIAARCDCGSATRRGTYVRCVRDAAAGEVAAGRLPAACTAAIVQCASRSTCGRPGAITCYRMDAAGTTACRVKRDASRCRAPTGGTAVVGATASCCDPRTVEGCS